MFLIKVGLEYFSYQGMKGTLFCDNLMFFVIAEMMMTGIIKVKISIKARVITPSFCPKKFISQLFVVKVEMELVEQIDRTMT